LDITAYDELYAGGKRVIAQYEANERGLYEFLWESSLPPEFPVIVEEGYFEVPRECTLEDLADTLDVDKSTASETIRRGTGRVIGQFFLDRD